MIRRLTLLGLALMPLSAAAQTPDYGLKPLKVAADTYVLPGKLETFSTANGGNIANTAFIVTRAGVVVIDTGPSKLYGEAMRRAIAQITPLPVVKVVNTHLHPDHVFGNQAFTEARIEALPDSTRELSEQGKGFTEGLYRLVGGWMAGTELRLPDKAPRSEDVGGHRLEMVALTGHTHADLVVLDRTTGTLFASDLVFLDRAPATPHADIAAWLAALDAIERLPFTTLVPGHGPVHRGDRGIAQTRDWLTWLRATLKRAAEDGLDMSEAMALPIPDRFRTMALAREELVRSVVHLYPRLERDTMRRAEVKP